MYSDFERQWTVPGLLTTSWRERLLTLRDSRLWKQYSRSTTYQSRMKEAGNDKAFGQIQDHAVIDRDDALHEELRGFMAECKAAMKTTMRDDEAGCDAEQVARKTKELEERERKIQKTEEDLIARLSQVESMQMQLTAMFHAAKGNKDIQTPLKIM